jgi:hypothetical protein
VRCDPSIAANASKYLSTEVAVLEKISRTEEFQFRTEKCQCRTEKCQFSTEAAVLETIQDQTGLVRFSLLPWAELTEVDGVAYRDGCVDRQRKHPVKGYIMIVYYQAKYIPLQVYVFPQAAGRARRPLSPQYTEKCQL